MLTHHLLDSLAIIAPLRSVLAPHSPSRMLDVGSGAGLPGVVVAICCPDVGVDCVDAVAKKAAFIRQVSLSLGLPNLRGLHARVENLTEKYHVICSRAFASLSDFAVWSSVALEDGGVWLAMKGRYPSDEVAALPAGVSVFHVEQLLVPGLGAERCIVWMKRVPPPF
jgi:16S rRNA (guanine527-N7)-methyltransferase